MLLDDVDKELERRGLRFVRYADDCNVYVQSKRAAERVMEGLIGLYAKLKLQVNVAKSAVAPVWERSFLGFSFWRAPGKIVKRRVAPKALKAMKERVRAITARTGGRSVARVATELRKYLVGWKAYFRLAETPGVFADLDKWIHRRLRALILTQWKRGRRRTASCARVVSADGSSRSRPAHASLVARLEVWGDASRLSRRVLRLARRAAPGNPSNLNSLNRRMRTRMSGGVGGR